MLIPSNNSQNNQFDQFKALFDWYSTFCSFKFEYAFLN